LIDIEYVDDPDEYVDYDDPLDSGAKIPFPINIGLIKRKAWNFESETRARVYIEGFRYICQKILPGYREI
jgi:hypothetical protein